ncbi:Crp/Fnr family transcriptional regulator [Aquirufa ecclesiirivi]|uniref:Crp/Fnr family transcriptional regulator n=1 Tax=Aquirufa ecclesiirivi TaxID=2715124 RepID=UPI0022A8874F|nr:Crp/Fnr family transcriptional regulator [Aquirufa ecclesiirivi]MCZ2472844.1 Crp/Fnr family transcriptional regulator [Aquirufa ecclesiirivi]
MIDEKLLVSWGGTYRTLEKNEVLFSEGTECLFYYQVVDGQLKWVNISVDGKEYLQRLINPGESLGEMPLFDDGPFAASSFALVKSTVIRLPKAAFHDLLRNHPDIHFEISRRLSQHLRFKFFMLKEVTSNEPEKLVVAVLNYLKNSNQYVSLDDHLVHLTRQQIADLTGLRVETVIRVIRNLHLDGKLKIENRKVFLFE